MADRVDRTERLLNLVIALMATTRPLPRHVVRDEIPGYREAASDAAFERMFERDKDELRSMGIPLETVVDDFGEVLGYRIPREAYGMPPIDLTVPERNAIAVAAHMWGHAAVAPVAGAALRKFQSLSADESTWIPTGLAGDLALTATDAALLPLMEAIRTDRRVSFAYRSPSATTEELRHVSPWRLTSAQGHWRVTGFDHDREAERTFRLSRITGAVTVGSEPRVPASVAAVRSPDVTDPVVRARILVTPRKGAALRRAAEHVASAANSESTFDAEEITVRFESIDGLLSALLAAGPDARVVEPPAVVTEVRARLAALVRAHPVTPR